MDDKGKRIENGGGWRTELKGYRMARGWRKEKGREEGRRKKRGMKESKGCEIEYSNIQ